MPTPRPFAVLFDVDGTLVDTNYLHVHAWARAFREENIDVESWRIHRSIGMDGSTLVATLSGDASDAVQHRLKDRHSSLYKDSSELIVRLPGARELLRHLAENEVQVVLASSAPEDELAITRKVLDSDDAIAAATSSKDVDTAKPDPSIVQIALERAGVSAEQAVFVGDAVWDGEAATRLGVPFIGLRCGGVADSELEKAGAQAVFDDPLDLLRHLETTVIGARLRDSSH
ncbi:MULTISPECIES: HAD family hydrolase [Mycolicibacterium]|uniref:HAD family hydrolase n=1 Tax=Mycolicibacterium senegalense TaxID=1796 RepID=A0A378WDD9_9MYCO|nr:MULTISPECIES: HAD family hydrolase [Mycolicibacterium]MCV7336508.1 HAD family hydrolase [Mycolicibacterium senegalense]MDR7291392.1 HAD superfamily hydrolase (TIGR01509 family) [Mycolicibacterium senegalense]QZA22882.1 HAD family hydrolase [Mycolicibacterium senegalense]CDP84108.1 haloacid dehalogenase superfamily protein [Mycolicibacterium farcinogenes]SUA32344.1 HAD family hydrolase [Mycolicibacterium senegalense]